MESVSSASSSSSSYSVDNTTFDNGISEQNVKSDLPDGEVMIDMPLGDEQQQQQSDSGQIISQDLGNEEQVEYCFSNGTTASTPCCTSFYDGSMGVYHLLLNSESDILGKKPKPPYLDPNFIKLCIMVLMVGSFFLVELVVGIIAGSLTLLADSFHMLSDGISLFIAIVALLVRTHHFDIMTVCVCSIPTIS